jgi:hypothetical protein
MVPDVRKAKICLIEAGFREDERIRSILVDADTKTLAHGRLRAGHRIKGLLLGRSLQPTVPFGQLALTLFVELVSGQEFPFE